MGDKSSLLPVAGLCAADLLAKVADASATLLTRRIFSYRQDDFLVCLKAWLIGCGWSLRSRFWAFLELGVQLLMGYKILPIRC